MQAPSIRIMTLAIALAICTPARPQANVPNFAGEYVMNGKGYGSNDSPYVGTCSIVEEDGMYKVSCFNQDTRHTYIGKGLAMGQTLAIFIGDHLRGDHNTVFAGEYLVVYQRQPDGRLVGTWLHAESRTSGEETLTPRQ